MQVSRSTNSEIKIKDLRDGSGFILNDREYVRMIGTCVSNPDMYCAFDVLRCTLAYIDRNTLVTPCVLTIITD